MMRRVLGSVALAATLALTALPATPAAATPTPKKLSLNSYTVTIGAPDAPATVCDVNEIHCGYLEVQATFAGLSRFTLPTAGGGPEGNLTGTATVTRVYGCADDAGRRLHRYDRTVTETAQLNTRRGSGVKFPRTGDTVTAATYAFLADAQPGNCPTGTTPTIYKLVAKHVRLQLVSYDTVLPQIPDGSYRAPYRGQWTGAVATPTPAAS